MTHASSLDKTAVLTGFEAGPNAAGIPHVDWLPTEGWHELWQKQCVHLCRQQQPACANLYLRACRPHALLTGLIKFPSKLQEKQTFSCPAISWWSSLGVLA